MQKNSNQCVVYQQPNKRHLRIDTPALKDQCWNPPTRALRDGELRAALTFNKTNGQFSESEDDGVPRKLRCGRITSTRRMALLAQKQRTKPGPLTKVKRKRAHASSEKKQVALTSEARTMGFRENFCYENSQVSGSLLLRDQRSSSDRSQK
jgi:hypothetical protein